MIKKYYKKLKNFYKNNKMIMLMKYLVRLYKLQGRNRHQFSFFKMMMSESIY